MSEPIIINIPSVENWTTTDLKYACRKNKIKGYTKMDRNLLIEEVKKIGSFNIKSRKM